MCVSAQGIACLWQHACMRTELQDRGGIFTPPKVLPLDGDYPGGTSGIPLDGYWNMETAHGATPYFSDAGTDFMETGVNPQVVTSPNVLDFGYNPAGAVKSHTNSLKGSKLAQLGRPDRGQNKLQAQQLDGWANSYGKGGQIYAYSKIGDSPVNTRPDAGCYFCLKTTPNEWQRYRSCAQVCVVADCVGQCEEKYAANNFGPTAPVHVTKMCMRECEVGYLAHPCSRCIVSCPRPELKHIMALPKPPIQDYTRIS